VAVNSDGRLQVFAVATDNQLWFRSQSTAGSNTWSAWTSLGGSIKSNPSVAVNSDGRLQVFAVASDNQLWFRSQTAAGSNTWSAWTSLGGSIKSNPAVAVNSDGRLQVFAVAAGNQLYFRSQSTAGSNTWSAWTSLGGTLKSDPAVARNLDGRLAVFVVGAGNALYHKWQSSTGSNTWSAWISLGGRIDGSPAVTQNQDGRLEAFGIGANNDALYHKWQTSSSSGGDGDLYDDFESGSTYSLTDGQISPNGKWKSLYAGFGTTRVTQDQLGNRHLYQEPMTSTSPGETHGSAVATTTSYKDFDLTLDVITFKQLRQNSPPNNWETAWLNWNGIDQFHSYGFTLKIQGFQLEKKDNDNHDDSAEIYLVTQNSPSVKLNTWQKWQITVTGTETGTPRIQVWIDGAKIVDYTDNQPGIPPNSETMKQGGPIVLYTEDAAVGFDNVHIRPL
jgi:hypothetical protein